MKRVGILTSGGDCQALNATIRGIAKALYQIYDDEVEIIGFLDGYKGLMYEDYVKLAPIDFTGLLTKGGTILGTSRQPFKTIREPDENGLDKVEAMKTTYRRLRLDCLYVLGGNGSQKTANLLSEEGPINWLYFTLAGIMTLVLVFGDAFHLVPRILAAVNPEGNYAVSLGIGKLITSITMTLFYLILYFVYSMRYKYQNKSLQMAMIVLTVVRIALCLFPQNDWTGESPVIWGVYRNIPFLVMGIIMVVLFFQQRSDKAYSLMYLAIILSFLFYIPVVLWADVHPMIGMFMLPKTCMYIWMVVMGYQESKRNIA